MWTKRDHAAASRCVFSRFILCLYLGIEYTAQQENPSALLIIYDTAPNVKIMILFDEIQVHFTHNLGSSYV